MAHPKKRPTTLDMQSTGVAIKPTRGKAHLKLEAIILSTTTKNTNLKKRDVGRPKGLTWSTEQIAGTLSFSNRTSHVICRNSRRCCREASRSAGASAIYRLQPNSLENRGSTDVRQSNLAWRKLNKRKNDKKIPFDGNSTQGIQRRDFPGWKFDINKIQTRQRFGSSQAARVFPRALASPEDEASSVDSSKSAT